MATFEENTWVWMPDPEEQALPAKVLATFKAGEAGKVRTEDGEDHNLDGAVTAKITAADTEVLSSKIDNLINLNDLNENAILHNLRIRFKEDQIYTNVSSILVSVNPFKLLALYTPETMDAYRQNARDLPPHVFQVADAAYRGMLSDRKDQSVVISGESGAGKSEATKLMLQYIADVSSRASGGRPDSNSGSLEQQILQANPIMEAFGNAKTVRNNNSSRFGKLITVKFDTSGAICGGSIINYLLEKSRVVFQSEGERNYHVFYQLIAGGKADPALQQSLQTTDAVDYHFLDQSGVVEIEGINDEKDFNTIRRAFDTLKLDEQQTVLPILQTTAAVLHLGNVQFEVVKKAMEEDSSAVANPEVLRVAAQLLGFDEETLTKNLISKNIGNRSVIMVSFSVEKAQEARDALCKNLYGNLFQLIIDTLNKSLAEGQTQKNHANIIGVLDIFGFESFEKNSFEQLCINFCNEKLQFHFNEHIFRLEQEVYAAEGVNVPKTDFKDNQPTLDMLELKGTGIFPMIDEEITVPRGSDETLLNKLQNTHAKHENFVRTPASKLKVPNERMCFGVIHYAGVVYYDVTNFLDKNKDQLHDDVKSMIKNSTIPLVGTLINEDGAGADAGKSRTKTRGPSGKSKTKTLGGQFKASLASLVTTLNATEPSFVRCVKPNKEKCGDLFESDMVLAQLRYSGLLEVCRIRKLGYPVRRDNEEFFKRYKVIEPSATDLKSLVELMKDNGKLGEGQFALGTSKVFMKNKQAAELDVLRDQAFVIQALRVQASLRRWLCQVKVKKWRVTIAELGAAIKTRVEEDIQTAFDLMNELPNGGKHLQVYKDAHVLLIRLGEERKLLSVLQAAIESRSKATLLSAVEAAKGMDPPFEHASLGEAEALIALIEKEEAVRNQLREAMGRRDLPSIDALITQAEELSLEGCEEYKQAVALKARLEEEQFALESLRKAIEDRDMNTLSAFLSKCSEMGLAAPEIDQGKKLYAELQAQVQAKNALNEACNQRDLAAIKAAMSKCEALGVDAQSLSEAGELVDVIEKEEKARSQLVDACEARTLEALEAALQFAEEVNLKGDEVSEAENLKASIIAETACLGALSKAVAANNTDALGSALAEAARLGLKGLPEVEAANEALSKLSAATEGVGKLVSVSSSDSVEEIEAALAEAEKLGLQNESAFANASARRDRLLEEQALVKELVEATQGGDLQILSRHVASCMRLGISNKYPTEMAAAKAKASELGKHQQVMMALVNCVNSKDLGGLEAALENAKQLGLDESSDEVARALAMKERLVAEEAADKVLAEAMETPDDLPKLRAAVESAQALGVDTDRLQQAKVVLNRDEMIAETEKLVDSALETKSLEKLNHALEQAINLGLRNDRIDEATRLRDQFASVEEAIKSILAAKETLALKSSSAKGIAQADVDGYNAKMETHKSIVEDYKEREDVKGAIEFQQKVTQQLKVQDMLQQASDNPNADRKEIYNAISEARELELNLDVMADLSKRLKDLDAEYQKQREANDEPLEAGYEDTNKATEERNVKAEQKKYAFANYPGLRSPEDFAKGVILQKRKLKDNMLKWQSNQIPRSLTELDSENSKLAVQVHKSLLGYMGDKQMQYPATLAQDILQKGLEKPKLRDEIYLLIMKQLSTNPTADSIAKGWQMMCMCVSTFPPSADFELYLLNFMHEQKKKKGAVRNYAKYCHRTLDGILASGASGFVPSTDEIQAYKERPPVLATVELVDGTLLTEELPVTPDLNVGKVVEICTHFLELTDPRSDTMGIFVYDIPPTDSKQPDPDAEKPYADLERTPRPLRNEDYMGDVIVQKARQKREFKFVYKRKIFLPSQNSVSEDTMFNRLVYLQAEDEVITQGNLPIKSEDLARRLSAISYRVAMDATFPASTEEMIHHEECPVIDFVVPEWRGQKTVEEWAQHVLAQRDELLGQDADLLQQAFVEEVWNHDLYGSHFFNVHKLNNDSPIVQSMPNDLKLAFNSSGMWIFDLSMNIIQSYGYADIYRWGGSSSQFSLIIWNQEVESTFELKLSTAQAADMAGIILDYINAIMAAAQLEG